MTEDSGSEGDLVTPITPSTDGPASEPMEIRDFLDGASVEDPRSHPSNLSVSSIDSPTCWYCGVAEAIGWFLGTLIVHTIGGVFAFVGVAIYMIVSTGKPPRNIQDPVILMIVTAGEMFIFVLASLLAFSLRYWGRAFQELNLSLPDPRHVFIVAFGTLPLSFCVSAWGMPIQWGWNYVTELFPVLKFLDGMNVMEAVQEMAQNTPLWVMILVVAVLPAIGEELVFRGAIGRVLIANLGLWGGIVLTSIMFGLIHIHPVHALAVIPLGVGIHLIYLWTRSFWLPMLLHFLNNSWASFSAQSNSGDPVKNGANLTALESIELASAAVAVVFLGFALWQSRVRFFHDDGREFNSGRFPIRVPAPPGILRKAAPINVICAATAIVCVIVCHLTVVVDLMRPAVQAI